MDKINSGRGIMPIYEYLYRDWGLRFESLRSMQDADAPIECPGCKSLDTGRLINAWTKSNEFVKVL
jgi:putative FmdB family regulatory protein